MIPLWWSVLLTVVGITGFLLAGCKVWWAWYVNIGCQFLWAAYAVATQQWGFIAASAVYAVVFTRNAVAWTIEHREEKRRERRAHVRGT